LTNGSAGDRRQLSPGADMSGHALWAAMDQNLPLTGPFVFTGNWCNFQS
jgi:hypothetical protein